MELLPPIFVLALALLGYAAYFRYRSARQARIFESLSEEARCLACDRTVALRVEDASNSGSPAHHRGEEYRCEHCGYDPRAIRRDPDLEALSEVLRRFALARGELDAALGEVGGADLLERLAGGGLGGALVAQGEAEESARLLRSARETLQAARDALAGAWKDAGIPDEVPNQWLDVIEHVVMATKRRSDSSLQAARAALSQLCCDLAVFLAQRSSRPELWAPGL